MTQVAVLDAQDMDVIRKIGLVLPKIERFLESLSGKAVEVKEDNPWLNPTQFCKANSMSKSTFGRRRKAGRIEIHPATVNDKIKLVRRSSL